MRGGGGEARQKSPFHHGSSTMPQIPASSLVKCELRIYEVAERESERDTITEEEEANEKGHRAVAPPWLARRFLHPGQQGADNYKAGEETHEIGPVANEGAKREDGSGC